MNELTIHENLKWAHPPGAGWPLWVWALALLGLAGAGGVYFLRQRRQRAAAAAAAGRPAHEKALEALEKARELLQEETAMAFILEVSRILRVYIQDRFSLRAPHRSTEEFLLEASASDLLGVSDQELLGDFLRQCDLVKFARRQAALRQMETLWQTAAQFVHDSIPRPEVPAAR